MAKETETKVLDVASKKIELVLIQNGAELILDTTLTVDWFGLKGLYDDGKKPAGEDPWYLRVRSDSQGKTEITWKAQAVTIGVSRNVSEINVSVDSHKKARDFLQALDLVHYAHQEKKRKSWNLKNWRFDLDEYPGMPPYLEIEGGSEGSVQEAIRLLSLGGYKTWAEGERLLIQNMYGLDWYDMRF